MTAGPKPTAAASDELEITLADGQTVVVPALWLRQACGCPACRTSPLGQRTYELDGLLDALLATEAGVRATLRETRADGVVIDFVEGDVETVHAGFVSFEAIRSAFAQSDRSAPWLEKPNWLGESAIEADEHDMAHLVATQIAERGLALVRGVPVEAGEVLAFARRIGFVRDTNYGALFDVRSEPNPDNLAYSSAGLSAHTDNPYRDPCPTVQLLHCLRQAGTGGRSVFVDGFGVADRLRTNRPADFKVLSSTAVAFQYRDKDVDLRAVAPVIATGSDGSLTQVRFNNRSMVGPVGLTSPAQVENFFAAYRRFATDLQDAAGAVRLRLAPGELVVFNNRRVLHGREAFELTAADGDRWLQGCYIDLDALNSLARRSSGC